MFGRQGNDTLLGTAGNHSLNAGEDNDFLNGGKGRDTLIGGSGDDTVIGGLGNDILTGGADDDIFVLAIGEGQDSITDFQPEQDLIGLSGCLSFGQLTIIQNGSDALISVNSTGEILASLTGMNASQLESDDFITDVRV